MRHTAIQTMILSTCIAGASLAAVSAQAADASLAPQVVQKPRYKVGFAQSENDNPWRIAETKSMRDIAAKCNWDIVVTDAGSSAAKQVSDIDNLIAQKVDLLVVPPREEKPLIPAVMKAKRAKIPLILVDRNVDQKVVQAGRDYVTFIGSDFVDQGRRAAQWLIDKTGGKATIIELEGSTGSSPANDRKRGFDELIKKQPGMKIVASQNGEFNRNKGRQVAETLLQAHPDVTAVYAHNDEMAIGAIVALEAAGKVPGRDVTVVSVDGTRDALQLIAAGKMGATVQSSPFFGPLACQTAQRSAKGEKIEPWVKVKDTLYDKSNAAASMSSAY
jgi:ABC-type sugar transport system substrate-binding protein